MKSILKMCALLALCALFLVNFPAHASASRPRVITDPTLRLSRTKAKTTIVPAQNQRVSVKVYRGRKSTKLVKTLATKLMTRETTYTVSWNGRNAKGRYVDPGTYRIVTRLGSRSISRFVKVRYAFTIPYTCVWPTPRYKRLTSRFNEWRSAWGGARGHHHAGVDIKAPVGAPIVSMANGVVTKVVFHDAAQGNYVEITHANHVKTRYLHQRNHGIKVHRGQRVVAGQRIGTVGSTGRSTGSHLHFEILVHGKPKIPLAFVKR